MVLNVTKTGYGAIVSGVSLSNKGANGLIKVR